MDASGSVCVAFASHANNLAAGVLFGLNVYVKHLGSNVTTLVSVNSLGAAGNGDSSDPSLAARGGGAFFAAFRSSASNLADNDFAVIDAFYSRPDVIVTSNGGGGYASIDVLENESAVTTVTADDVGSHPLTFALSTVSSVANQDAGLFTIDENTGVLRFLAAPNYEAPLDVGHDNTYRLIVVAANGVGGEGMQEIVVRVIDIAPVNVKTYVNAAWTGLAIGTLIADADPSLTGNQPAVYGTDAFANLQNGVDGNASSATTATNTGTVVVWAGNYPDDVELSGRLALKAASGVVQIDGVVSGAGFVKTGNGLLRLTAVNEHAGTTVSAGALEATHDEALGAADAEAATGAGGELRVAAGSTSRTFQNAGTIAMLGTWTLDGATIVGGFVKGVSGLPRTQLLTVAGAASTFIGVTFRGSVELISRGDDSFSNATNF